MRRTAGQGRGIDFVMPFDRREIPKLVRQFLNEDTSRSPNDKDMEELLPSIQRQHCLTLDQLRTVARWKSPRSARLVDGNSEGYVRDVTGIALSTPTERLRVEVLTLLDGVSWPTASVILHWFHEEPYPILDTRVVDALGASGRNHLNFAFWRQYTDFLRGKTIEAGVIIRDMDRALWQYSKNSGRGG